jgi:quercetin dioxygenase-like cupin family protein
MGNPLLESTLKELRELTEALPRFPDVSDHAGDEGCGWCRRLDLPKGTGIYWILVDEPTVTAIRVFNSRGSEFPLHAHVGREWLIVYEGSMVVTVEGNSSLLRAGESCIIESGSNHFSTYPEDCWTIAIAIPAEEGWVK